jgi:hypothetical protein
MRTTRQLLMLAALAAVAAACAAPRATPRPAHGTFDPAQAKRTTAGALETVAKRGFELAFHDAPRGLILTRTKEGQAPCGRTECLVRDTYVIRLEEGHAVAVLTRQLFDAALRAWEPPAIPPISTPWRRTRSPSSPPSWPSRPRCG